MIELILPVPLHLNVATIKFKVTQGPVLWLTLCFLFDSVTLECWLLVWGKLFIYICIDGEINVLMLNKHQCPQVGAFALEAGRENTGVKVGFARTSQWRLRTALRAVLMLGFCSRFQTQQLV